PDRLPAADAAPRALRRRAVAARALPRGARREPRAPHADRTLAPRRGKPVRTWLLPALHEDADLREADPEIAWALPADTAPQRYDAIAATYDRVVSHPLYMRLAWGSSPANEAAFAARALASAEDGLVLDAGCGSLGFTAGAHLASSRRTLLLDL